MQRIISKDTGITYYLYHHDKTTGIYMVKSGLQYDASIWTYSTYEFNDKYEVI